VDHGLVIPELTLAQGNVESAGVEECPALEAISVEVVVAGFSPRDGSRRAGAAEAVTMGAGGAGDGSCGACGVPGIGNRCSKLRMWSRVFCCTLACSLALESSDSSLETRSSASESIGDFSGSSEFCFEEEGVLGAVNRGSPSHSVQSCI
jgi:hypothetical protein